MRIRYIILAVVMVFTLAGCSNVKDMKFTDSNREEVIGKIIESGELTDAEKEKAAVVIGRAQAQGTSLTGKTVGELLNEKP